MENVWVRVETALSRNAPEMLRALRPGAPKARITRVEKALSITFPDEVRESYRIHDGQSSDGPGLFDGWEFLPLSRVLDEWRVWKELADGGEFKGRKSKSNGTTRKDWWHPAWIPLSSDGAGNHHCLDFAPGPKGAVGQIIRFLHDDAERLVVAANFSEWLDGLADELDLENQLDGRTVDQAAGSPTMDDLIGLIGEPVSSPEVLRVLGSCPMKRKVEKWGFMPTTGHLWNKALGFEIEHNKKGRIETIHLFIVPTEEYAAFSGALSKGLRPEDGVDAVRGRFGKPTRSAPQGRADRFDSDRLCLYIGYRDDGKGIRLITLMAPEVAP